MEERNRKTADSGAIPVMAAGEPVHKPMRNPRAPKARTEVRKSATTTATTSAAPPFMRALYVYPTPMYTPAIKMDPQNDRADQLGRDEAGGAQRSHGQAVDEAVLDIDRDALPRLAIAIIAPGRTGSSMPTP